MIEGGVRVGTVVGLGHRLGVGVGVGRGVTLGVGLVDRLWVRYSMHDYGSML